jgi:hypothetical protein
MSGSMFRQMYRKRLIYEKDYNENIYLPLLYNLCSFFDVLGIKLQGRH